MALNGGHWLYCFIYISDPFYFSLWRKTRIFVPLFRHSVAKSVLCMWFCYWLSMFKQNKTWTKKIYKIIVTWANKPWKRANLLALWLELLVERLLWCNVRGIIAYQKEMANNLMIYILWLRFPMLMVFQLKRKKKKSETKVE